MKKILLILPIAMLLVACGQKSTTITEVAPPKTPEETSQFAVDQKNYLDAVKLNMAALCDVVVNAEMKTNCRLTVEGSLAAQKAISANNLQLCKTIQIEGLRKGCEVQIKEQLDAKAKSEASAKMLEKAEASLDLEACGKLAEEYQKQQCVYNVSVTLAIQEKNQKQCDAISDPELRENCRSLVNTSTAQD